MPRSRLPIGNATCSFEANHNGEMSGQSNKNPRHKVRVIGNESGTEFVNTDVPCGSEVLAMIIKLVNQEIASGAADWPL
jgi:hypothetical protein